MQGCSRGSPPLTGDGRVPREQTGLDLGFLALGLVGDFLSPSPGHDASGADGSLATGRGHWKQFRKGPLVPRRASRKQEFVGTALPGTRAAA